MPRPRCRLNDVIGETCRKQSRTNSPYCSTICKNRYHYINNKNKEKHTVPTTVQKSTARGPRYEEFCREWASSLEAKQYTHQQVADLMGIDRTTVSKMWQAYQEDKAIFEAQKDWEIAEETVEALNDFKDFRNRYFKTETGDLYETADFHENWINHIVDAIKNGKQQMILSPPRHGKTDLLTHFAVWQICKNPNIRIMWVGGNEDIAKNAVGSVLDHLENNELLNEEINGPGIKFQPKIRSGKSWSSSQFTVGTRTVTGIKSPTMVAVGKGGKILSRDCDIIIADDIEDHQTTQQPGARESTRQWWTTTLSSRKEEHTAVVVIGSRQHPDDLYNHLLESDNFTSIVETAHKLDCEIPEHSEEEHVECMLWPTKRSFKWLMSRLHSAESTGGRQTFEMVYYNQAYVEGTQIFTMNVIDQCMRPDLVLGQVYKNLYLVAGLDPASSGYQASVLWGIDQYRGELYLVDLENKRGGGIRAALDQMAQWLHDYDCRHWIVEENGFQTAIRQDAAIKEFTLRTGITVQGHLTGKNKHDPLYGVGAMADLFEDKRIHLPVGDGMSNAKVQQYRQQLLYFDGKPVSKRNKEKTDIVMASWFPMKVFRRMQKEHAADIGLDYNPSYGDYKLTDMNNAPWE